MIETYTAAPGPVMAWSDHVNMHVLYMYMYMYMYMVQSWVHVLYMLYIQHRSQLFYIMCTNWLHLLVHAYTVLKITCPMTTCVHTRVWCVCVCMCVCGVCVCGVCVAV